MYAHIGLTDVWLVCIWVTPSVTFLTFGSEANTCGSNSPLLFNLVSELHILNIWKLKCVCLTHYSCLIYHCLTERCWPPLWFWMSPIVWTGRLAVQAKRRKQLLQELWEKISNHLISLLNSSEMFTVNTCLVFWNACIFNFDIKICKWVQP